MVFLKEFFVGHDLGPNWLQRSSADDTKQANSSFSSKAYALGCNAYYSTLIIRPIEKKIAISKNINNIFLILINMNKHLITEFIQRSIISKRIFVIFHSYLETLSLNIPKMVHVVYILKNTILSKTMKIHCYDHLN